MHRQRWTILAVAIVWAAVLVAAAAVLRGTVYWAQVLPILGGGAAMTVLLVGAAYRSCREVR